MATEHVTIDGINELVKNMRELSDDLKGNPLRNAARAMAKIVHEAAVQKAPEDTGRLKRAIKMRLLSVKDRDAATKVGDSRELFDIYVKTGRTRDDPKGAYYWWMVENGTIMQPAKPFIRPAFYDNEAKLPDAFAAKLKRSLELAANRRSKRMLAKGRA